MLQYLRFLSSMARNHGDPAAVHHDRWQDLSLGTFVQHCNLQASLNKCIFEESRYHEDNNLSRKLIRPGLRSRDATLPNGYGIINEVNAKENKCGRHLSLIGDEWRPHLTLIITTKGAERPEWNSEICQMWSPLISSRGWMATTFKSPH